MCYYMSYLPLYHLVLFIEIDFYVLLHELSPIICELKRDLYGIKCVLRIFLTNMVAYCRRKKNLTLCKHRFPCNTLTHSTNENLLNIKRKCDPEVSYPLSYVRYH